MNDKDSTLQLSHTLLLHGHLAAVHVQGLPVQLWEKKGSPSTVGFGTCHTGTFQFLHGQLWSPPDQPNAILSSATAASASSQDEPSLTLPALTSPIGHKVIFHQGSQPQGLLKLCGVRRVDTRLSAQSLSPSLLSPSASLYFFPTPPLHFFSFPPSSSTIQYLCLIPT